MIDLAAEVCVRLLLIFGPLSAATVLGTYAYYLAKERRG